MKNTLKTISLIVGAISGFYIAGQILVAFSWVLNALATIFSNISLTSKFISVAISAAMLLGHVLVFSFGTFGAFIPLIITEEAKKPVKFLISSVIYLFFYAIIRYFMLTLPEDRYVLWLMIMTILIAAQILPVYVFFEVVNGKYTFWGKFTSIVLSLGFVYIKYGEYINNLYAGIAKIDIVMCITLMLQGVISFLYLFITQPKTQPEAVAISTSQQQVENEK